MLPYRHERRAAAPGSRPGSPPAGPGGGRWQAPEAPGSAGEPIEAAFREGGDPVAALVPLAPMLAQLQGLGEQLTALAGRNEALALEAGQLRERTAQQEATIAELRRRAEAAEAERLAAEEERDALRLQLAEVSVPPVVVVAGQEVPEGAIGTIPTSTTAQGLWARLRRTLRGG